MPLRTQFESLLTLKGLNRKFVDCVLSLKLFRFDSEGTQQVETIRLGPFPSWFTLYEVKLSLWNQMNRNPIFSPALVFIGIPQGESYYTPLEMVWMMTNASGKREILPLVSPFSLIPTGSPDTRFVDSAGNQKAVGKDDRIRMILNDVFQLDDGKDIPELHVFLYADLVDRIPGPRPLGERDAYGRIMPYFPYLDPHDLPPSSGTDATTTILVEQANQTASALKQSMQLDTIPESAYQVPTLNGVKFMRWVWNQIPLEWEGPSIVFFGVKVTHMRPYMRFFSPSRQPLTKIRVKGLLPIPDLPSSSLLKTWRQDKNPDVGKECCFLKMCITQSTTEVTNTPIYSTMRVFNDGTADLLIMPPKQKRLLDISDLQDAPELLDASLQDMTYGVEVPIVGQADVVLKMRLKREDETITRSVLLKRLKAFSSIFQEIPALPEEQPLAMLRYKGVSNFNSEDRIFAFLTQVAAHELVDGEADVEGRVQRVANEFQISLEEARKHVVAWVLQKNEYTLAVPETRDYILNKNPGIDIAIFAQHPTYTLHIYRAQSFQVYNKIVHLLGLLLSAPSSQLTLPTAAAVTAATAAAPPVPVLPEGSPAVDGIELPEPQGVFPTDDDEIPEHLRQTMFAEEENEDEGEGEGEDLVVAAAPTPAAPSPAASASVAASAAKKPTDLKAIAVKKYYIERLKVADPDIFNYEHKNTSDRGYVTHCAANESRQPIVLDTVEYDEMRKIYAGDTDLQFVLYPEDTVVPKFKKKQPNPEENLAGKLDTREYPSNEDKEIVTLVKYGSKAKRLNYYFCPRLFCIKDRLMVRYKDFKATLTRDGLAKPANTCPFCMGTLIPPKIEDKARDPGMTVLERKARPGSTSERQIYIGFLGKKKTPSGLSLPCCFADPGDRFDINTPEFKTLGLRPSSKSASIVAATAAAAVPALAQPLANRIMGTIVEEEEEPIQNSPADTSSRPKYEPNYYRVLQGASVKSIVDANRIPLEIVIPKQGATDDPKAGPQIGLLPETLDKFFLQDSTSDKFADRIEIVRKLKPNAKGFLRLATDNTVQNRNQSLLSAIAPFLAWQPTAEKVIENIIEPRIPPRQFLQLNGGNLVHEFFNKCEQKQQNDMRAWVSKYVGIDELTSSNIPAIERLMNSYECFKGYLADPSRRKDLRVFYNALSEPGVLMGRGILFIVLEVLIEDTHVKKQGDKSEFKRTIQFDKIRCPTYPLSEGQQKADIGFLVHYNEVLHDRYNPEKKSYRHLGWEPLFYVDGTMPTAESRHKPTLFFQRSQEALWPPIVQRRVAEFFSTCTSVLHRGPFTSQYGMDPNALIAAQEIITGVRVQPSGIIRDSYNHFVGVAYRMPGKSYFTAVPIADDGSIHFERRLFLDWDDFHPAPVDAILDFYAYNIVKTFPQYKGYVPTYIQKSRDTQKIIGLTLQNGFSIPASDPKDPKAIAEMRIVEVDDLEWDVNRTIAYDADFRKKAFKDAEEDDLTTKDYVKLSVANIEEEIEDVYQHLRLTFSNWLATTGGRDIREAIRNVIKRKDLALNEKRKRLDILLEDKVTGWLQPRADEVSPPVGFLRVDCLVQGESECSGRCKWSSTDSTCKIHTPASMSPNGTVLQVPRLLYLRLVDELIRFAAKKEEIFSKQVPRLTIRRDAQRQGDQYIIPEDSPDWNTWWELLRTEWMRPEKEVAKFFDEQYEPIPSGVADSRSLPDSLKEALGATDPKTANLVWTPSTGDLPFVFLKSVIRSHPITAKTDGILSIEEVNEISSLTRTDVIYMPNGGDTSGILRKKPEGAGGEVILIAVVDGVVGWVSQKGSYGVKLPFMALPASL